jgi:hypothetical protein
LLHVVTDLSMTVIGAPDHCGHRFAATLLRGGGVDSIFILSGVSIAQGPP